MHPGSTTLVLVMAVASACGGAQPVPDVDSAAVEAQVTEVARAYHDAWETLDVRKIVSFHGEGFEYYFFDQRLTENFADIVRGEWFADTTAYRVEMVETWVRALGRDHAILTYRYRDQQTFEDGLRAGTTGLISYVFERRGDVWRIVRIHHSGPATEDLYAR